MQFDINELCKKSASILQDSKNPEVGFNRDEVQQHFNKLQGIMLNIKPTEPTGEVLYRVGHDWRQLAKLLIGMVGTYENKNGHILEYIMNDDNSISARVIK